MYIANHAYAVQGKDLEEGQQEIRALLDHATQSKYVTAVHWYDEGDLGEP
jgi:alpha-ketoglutarate-dependent 2,4-dichlorophenoxyacetate dioxygenase